MTNLYYRISICFLFLIFTNTCFSQSKVSKKINQMHYLSNDGYLILDNKYGDVYINGWENENVEIKVNIEVERKNESDAKELLNRITSEIVAANKQVNVKSVIKEKQTSFFGRYFNKIDPFKNEKGSTTITYTISLPNRANIEVNNKYGDIFISDWDGKLTAKAEHGDVRITDSISNAHLTIHYGKLRANTLNNSDIFLSDAEASVSQSNNLDINSKGSNIKLGSVAILELNSNKDTFEAEHLGTVFGEVDYSTISINELNTKADLELNLAELKILKFANETPNITVNQKSSEVYINISKTSFNFNATLEAGVLRIPKTMKNVESDLLDKKKRIRHIKAVYGDGKGNLNFTGVKGVVLLKEI